MKIPATENEVHHLEVSTPAFPSKGKIPRMYTCDGSNVNPAIAISGLPKTTKCLALIVDDPDAPAGTWVHWLVWNIPVLKVIRENSVPGIEGTNDFRMQRYGGPCPPQGKAHSYHFRIYALDRLLELERGAARHALEKAMSPYIIGYGEVTGTYSRALEK